MSTSAILRKKEFQNNLKNFKNVIKGMYFWIRDSDNQKYFEFILKTGIVINE